MRAGSKSECLTRPRGRRNHDIGLVSMSDSAFKYMSKVELLVRHGQCSILLTPKPAPGVLRQVRRLESSEAFV